MGLVLLVVSRLSKVFWNRPLKSLPNETKYATANRVCFRARQFDLQIIIAGQAGLQNVAGFCSCDRGSTTHLAKIRYFIGVGEFKNRFPCFCGHVFDTTQMRMVHTWG